MSSAIESPRAAAFARTAPETVRPEPAQLPSAEPAQHPSAEPAPSSAEPDRPPHPLRNRSFLTWWIGSSISQLGDQFYIVALPWVVLQITGSALAMGTVAMAAGIPRALLMLLGGAVTDRSSPRRLLMATAAARTVLVAAIGALLWLNELQLWHLYALAFAFGTADAFALPSSGAMLRTLVASEQLPAANSVWQSSAMLTAVVGPAPAGWIMKALGAAWAFFLDAISFLFIIVALWKLPEPSSQRTRASAPKPKVWVSIREGLSYVGSDVALRSLMLLAAVLNFCMAGPISIGLATMARQRFSSPAAFGAWISSVAAGTLIGMFLAGILKARRRGLLLLATGSILGVATGCMGLMPGLLPVAALLLVMGVFSGFINVQLQAWFQQRVDRAFLGRVVSLSMLSAYGLMPLSMAAAGAAVEWSTRGMFAISGAAVLLVSAFGLSQKPVREIQ